MPLTSQVLSFVAHPRTLAEVKALVGEAAYSTLARLVRNGKVAKYIYDRGDEERGKQQRRYITKYIKVNKQ